MLHLASFIGRHRDTYRVLGPDCQRLEVNEGSSAGILFALFRGLDERGFVTVEAVRDMTNIHREDMPLLTEWYEERQHVADDAKVGGQSQAGRTVTMPSRFEVRDATGTLVGLYRYRKDAYRAVTRLADHGEAGAVYAERCSAQIRPCSRCPVCFQVLPAMAISDTERLSPATLKPRTLKQVVQE